MAICDLRLGIGAVVFPNAARFCYCSADGRSVCGGTVSERVVKGKVISTACARGILLSTLFSLSLLSALSSLSPSSSSFFFSLLPQVASYHRYLRWPRDPVKMRPGSSANPVTQSVCAQARAQTLSVSQCTMLSMPVSQSVGYVQKAAVADLWRPFL